MELADLFAEDVDEDLTALLALLIFLENRQVDLVDLLTERALIPITTLFPSLFLLS